MKKIALLLIVAFILILVVSSCNQKACPAYSKADMHHTGQNVWFSGFRFLYFNFYKVAYPNEEAACNSGNIFV